MAGNSFDVLNYNYRKDIAGNTIQNRLYQVHDLAANSVATDDIDDQDQSNPIGVGHVYDNSLIGYNTTNNYRYDEIGNLKHDYQEQIEQIDWTVYGKIKKITRKAGSLKSDLEFAYDAAGNRIAKIEKPRDAAGLRPSVEWKRTYYARDAQGNILTRKN
jgi:hypothetical protein